MKEIMIPPLSTALFLILSLVYASGYYHVVQSSMWLTLLLTLLLPLVFWPLVKPVDNSGEIKRILWLESGFNLICFLMVAQWIDIPYLDNALMIFFIVQAGGFIWVQLKKQAYLSIVISICLAGAIAQWIYAGLVTQNFGNAELLLLGTPVSWQLKVIYGAWLVQLLFVKYKHILPKMTLSTLHVASYIIAIFANDFFHARIITASHFLFLSLCFDFKSPNWGGKNFVRLEKVAVIVSSKQAQWLIPRLMLTLCIVSFCTLFN